MDQESFKKLKKLELELKSSPGWEWEQRIVTHLGSTFQIFQGNSKEIIQAIKWYEKMEESIVLLDVKNRASQQAFLQEVLRLYHNYLASVLSLKEHTRRIVQKYEKEGYAIPEYTDIVKKYFLTPETQFIQESRNYMHHYSCIFIGWRLSYDRGKGNELIITYNLEELKKWDGWSLMSKKYIAVQSESPALLPLIERYSGNVNEFYQWFIKKMQENHQDSIIEVNRIREKMRLVENGISQDEIID